MCAGATTKQGTEQGVGVGVGVDVVVVIRSKSIGTQIVIDGSGNGEAGDWG